MSERSNIVSCLNLEFPLSQRRLGEAACATTLRGRAAARGTYVGRARVRLDDDAQDLQDGDVLVCRTMPSTLPRFANIGAVVTDAGGVLSNPAIVARERGIPTVVAARTATSLIRDGQRVVVDGERGVVMILSNHDAFEDIDLCCECDKRR